MAIQAGVTVFPACCRETGFLVRVFEPTVWGVPSYTVHCFTIRGQRLKRLIMNTVWLCCHLFIQQGVLIRTTFSCTDEREREANLRLLLPYHWHLIMPPQAHIHLDVACQLLVGSVARYGRTGFDEMTTLPSRI